MDFHSVKRKQLQALCKKHKIPANLKNVEMADRLAALLKVDDEKPKEQLVKPCLKNLEDLIVIDEEISEGKEHKKVRFSPQNETFVFEKTNPRAVRAATRRHSMAIGEVQVSKKGRISALEDVKEKGGENAADEQTRKLGAKQIRGVGKRKLSSMKQVEDLQTVPVEKIKPRAMRVTTRRRYSMAIGEDRTKERNLPALEDTKGKGSEYAADEKTRKLGAKKTRCASKRKLSSMEKSVDTVDNSEVGDPVNSVSEAVDIKNRLCHDSSVVEDNQGKSQPLLQTKSPSPLLDKCNSKKDVEGSCEESSLIKELETVIPSPVVVECEPNKGEGSLMKSTKLEILSNEEDQMTWTSNNLESSPLEKCIISNFSNLEDQISIDGMADLNSHPKINEFESSLQKSGDTTDNNCIDHAGKNRGYDQGAEEHTPTSTVKVLNSETIDEERDGITAENDSILCSEVPEGRIMTDVSDVNLGDNHAYNSGGSEYPAESEINHNQEEDESKIKTINEEIEVVISHVPEERNMLDVSDVQPKYSSDWLVNPTESEVNHKQPEGSDMVDDVSDVQMNENHEDATVADQNLEKAGYDQDAKGVTPTAVVNVDIKCTAGTVGTCISDKTEYPADSENDKAAESDSILVVDLSSKVPEVSTMIDVSVVDLGDNHDAYNSDRTEYSAEPDVNHKQVLEGLINSETINEEMTMIDVSDAEMCDNHDAYNSDRIEYSAEPDVHHNQGFEETNDSVDDVSDVQMNDNHEDAVLADQHLEKAGIQEADETNGSLDDTVDTERSYKKVLEEASNSNLNSDEESYGIDTLFQLGYVKDAENMIEVSNVELDKKASPHNGRKTDLVNSVSKFNICIQSSPPSKSTSLDKVGISVPVCELGLQGTYVPSSMIVESEPHNKDVFLNKNSEMEDQFAGTNPDLYNLESQSDIANVKSCSNLKSVDISEMSFMVSNEIVERDDQIGRLGSDNSISTISHKLGDKEEKHSASLVLPDDVIMTDVTGTIEVVPPATSIVENLKISEGIDYKHELEKKTISPASNIETNDITDASGVQLIDNHEQKVGNASDEESYDLASLFQSAYAEDESGFVDEKLQGGNLYEVSDVELDNNHEKEGLAGENMEVYEENGLINDELQGGNLFEVSDVELDNNHEKEALAGENTEVYEENGLINDELQGGNLYEVFDVEFDNNHEKEALAGENMEFYGENGLINDKFQGGNLFEVSDVELDKNHQNEALAGEDMEVYEENGIASQFQPEYAQDDNVLIDEELQGGENMEVDEEKDAGKTCRETYEVSERLGYVCHPELIMKSSVDEEKIGDENGKYIESREMIEMIGSSPGRAEPVKDFIGLDAGETCEDSVRLGDVLQGSGEKLNIRSSVIKEKNGDENGTWIESIAKPEEDLIGLAAFERFEQTEQQNGNENFAITYEPEKFDGVTPEIEGADGNVKGVCMEDEILPLNDEAEVSKLDKELVHSELSMTKIEDQCESANVKGVCMEDEISPLNDEAADIKLDKELVNDKGTCKEDEVVPLNDKVENSSLKPNCMMMNQKKRSILIHGTPIRPINTADMKENSNVHLKRELNMGDATAFRPFAKRKALGELHRS